MKKEVIEKENKLIEKETVECVKDKDKIDKKNSSKIIKIIFNIFFWIAVVVLAVIWVSDYMKVRDNKEPKYCLETKIHEFEDGSVKECIGLGYKTYKYERISMPNAIEFGPFFMKMREK